MHPSQIGPFRKTVIILLTLVFAGSLLVFTAQANLDLLKSVYPDPKFYMFGLLALEGGVVYWTGYYLLHPHGVHKGLAVLSLAVDAVLSGVGFFYEMEQVTKSMGTVSLPPIIIVVGFAILFNVGMAIISHLIPGWTLPNDGGNWHRGSSDDSPPYLPPSDRPKKEHPSQLTQAQLAQTSGGPSLIARAASSIGATVVEVKELTREKVEARKQQPSPLSQPLPENDQQASQ